MTVEKLDSCTSSRIDCHFNSLNPTGNGAHFPIPLRLFVHLAFRQGDKEEQAGQRRLLRACACPSRGTVGGTQGDGIRLRSGPSRLSPTHMPQRDNMNDRETGADIACPLCPLLSPQLVIGCGGAKSGFIRLPPTSRHPRRKYASGRFPEAEAFVSIFHHCQE